jgi:hypothetical protein
VSGSGFYSLAGLSVKLIGSPRMGDLDESNSDKLAEPAGFFERY